MRIHEMDKKRGNLIDWILLYRKGMESLTDRYDFIDFIHESMGKCLNLGQII